MSMFNKLLGRKDDSPPKDKSPKSLSPSQDFNTTGGFLCPLCYLSFENSDMLTSHFNRVHDETSEASSPNTSFIESQSNDSQKSALKTSTSRSSFNPKIESILKKYVSGVPGSDGDSQVDTKSLKSQKSFTSYTEPASLEAELQTWKEQLQLSENTRLTLSSDLLEYQNENRQLSSKLNKMKKDQQLREEKETNISNEMESLKIVNGQLKSENESIKMSSLIIQEEFIQKSQKLTEMEKELSLRPTNDDLNLLKEEIVKVQKLTDTIVKEKESKHQQLQREFNSLKAELETKKQDLTEMTAKTQSLKELDELKAQTQKHKESEADFKNQIQLLEEAAKEKDTNIGELNLNVLQLRQELESKNARIQNLEIESKELKDQHNQLNETVSELETKKIELDAKLVSLNSSRKRSESEREVDFENLYKGKEALESELTKLKTKFQALSEEKLHWLKEKDEFLSAKQLLENKSLVFENKIKSLDAQILKSNSQNETQRQAIELLESEKKHLIETYQSLEREKSAIDKQAKELEFFNRAQSEQIDKLTADNEEIQKEKESLAEELNECENCVELANASLVDNEKKINNLTDKIASLESIQCDSEAENHKLMEEVKCLESNSESLRVKVKALEEKSKSKEEENLTIFRKMKEVNQEKDEISKRNSELTARLEELNTGEEYAKKKLAESEQAAEQLKLKIEEMSSKLEEANNENLFLKSNLISLKKIETELNKTNESLTTNIDKIIKDMERVKLERDECEKLRLDSGKKHDLNMQALNQNLANLRAELKREKESFTKCEEKINTVKGENLEMEAKLSNCLDCNNQLLERCVVSEKLCESMKVQNIELKRRYEDTQSALQELGREHQELQIQNYKKSNYKWIDDSQVADCTQCKKTFSVTIRKHHCRNCGQIYCYECSDHTAIVSSSKKPQRVCKACFIEINNN